MQVTTTVVFEDRTIEAEGTWIPFVRGCNYMSNGDPGFPDEGGYFEEILCDGEFSVSEMMQIENALLEAIKERV